VHVVDDMSSSTVAGGGVGTIKSHRSMANVVAQILSEEVEVEVCE
jgi:hypothetical protein